MAEKVSIGGIRVLNDFLVSLGYKDNVSRCIYNKNDAEKKYGAKVLLSKFEDFCASKSYSREDYQFAYDLLKVKDEMFLTDEIINEFCSTKYRCDHLLTAVYFEGYQNVIDALEKFCKDEKYSDSDAQMVVDRAKDLIERMMVVSQGDLIYLIESVTGENIQAQEVSKRFSERDHRLQVVKYNGTTNRFVFSPGLIHSNSDPRKVYTNRQYGEILRSDIDFSKFAPRHFGLDTKGFKNEQDDEKIAIMKPKIAEILSMLGANLEIFNKLSSKIGNQNLNNGQNFSFQFVLTDENLPHLLGIPRGCDLTDDAIKALNKLRPNDSGWDEGLNVPNDNDGNTNGNVDPYKLSSSSSAKKVLNALIHKSKAIVNAGGVYRDEDGNLKLLMDWSKMLIKNNAFLRCDIADQSSYTCRLDPTKYMSSSKNCGCYVMLFPTNFNNQTLASKSSKNNNLDQDESKKKSSYVVLEFIKDSGTGLQVPMSVETWMGETVNVHLGKNHTGNDYELLKTLNRLREKLEGSTIDPGPIGPNFSGPGGGNVFNVKGLPCDFGGIVSGVTFRNQDGKIFMEKKFTEEEQMDVYESVQSDGLFDENQVDQISKYRRAA